MKEKKQRLIRLFIFLFSVSVSVTVLVWDFPPTSTKSLTAISSSADSDCLSHETQKSKKSTGRIYLSIIK